MRILAGCAGELGAVRELRDQIAAIDTRLEALRTVHLAPDALRARIRAYLEDQRDRYSGRSELEQFRVPHDPDARARTEFPTGGLHETPWGASPALTLGVYVELFGVEPMAEAMFRSATRDGYQPGATPEEREELRRQLWAERDALEEREELAILAVEATSGAVVIRRPDADPDLLLALWSAHRQDEPEELPRAATTKGRKRAQHQPSSDRA